jgi:hypothetical protein
MSGPKFATAAELKLHQIEVPFWLVKIEGIIFLHGTKTTAEDRR